MQIVPHEPQLFASARREVSQPFVALPSQLPNPNPQVNAHAPFAHAGDAFARAGHTPPQTPQFEGLVCRLTSQPSAGAALQLPKPAAHPMTVQVPALHPLIAFAATHVLPQRPQFAESLPSCVSQPSSDEPLQSP